MRTTTAAVALSLLALSQVVQAQQGGLRDAFRRLRLYDLFQVDGMPEESIVQEHLADRRLGKSKGKGKGKGGTAKKSKGAGKSPKEGKKGGKKGKGKGKGKGARSIPILEVPEEIVTPEEIEDMFMPMPMSMSMSMSY